MDLVNGNVPKQLDTKDILKIMPHRYPFLLVDKITEFEPGKFAKGYKNISFNEPYFQGHFPNEPIMPGVLQLEALAQSAAPVINYLEKYQGKTALFAGLDNVRFKNIVRPGDRLDLEVVLTKIKGPIVKFDAKSSVDGKICAEAELMLIIK